jgi:hypothetical protein
VNVLPEASFEKRSKTKFSSNFLRAEFNKFDVEFREDIAKLNVKTETRDKTIDDVVGENVAFLNSAKVVVFGSSPVKAGGDQVRGGLLDELWKLMLPQGP